MKQHTNVLRFMPAKTTKDNPKKKRVVRDPGRTKVISGPVALLSMRVPIDVFERADALVDPLSSTSSDFRAVTSVTRSSVLRLALLRGLELLEEELLSNPKRR